MGRFAAEHWLFLIRKTKLFKASWTSYRDKVLLSLSVTNFIVLLSLTLET
jgi:hypothetical protein